MGFFRQTWTLCEKTLTIVFMRHWLGTLIRAFLAPIIFMFIISYAKNFFVPPSSFGIGTPTPLRSLREAVNDGGNGRDTIAFVNGGHTGGSISRVIEQVSQPIRDQGKTVLVLESSDELLTRCPSSVRGVTSCFAAVAFYSSPSEGPFPIWNYTIRTDGAFGTHIYVDQNNNDAEIYSLPLQHAVDSAIASLNGSSLPDVVNQFPFTDQTPKQRTEEINRLYMGTLIDILAVAYFIGIVGICYQLTGEMAKERELGMSQLIEAMMPNRKRWTPQAARLLSIHISFDILYLPSWVIMSLIVARLNYPHSSAGILVGYFILSGFALSSWSVGFASLFKRAQLSGITVVITSIILAIIVQVVPPASTAAATVLSLLFPPMNYVLFIIYMAYWQQQGEGADLSKGPPTAPWNTPGYLFFLFSAIQIVAFPIIGAALERTLYGTASKARKLRYNDSQTAETVKLTNLSKEYPPNWIERKIGARFTKDPKQTVHAVKSLNVSVLRGQIAILLGANGSGKSTTLDMLAGLQVPTSGEIELDATGGIGLCPQKNVLWDELTVLEHVRIFNKLKAQKVDTKAAMKQLVSDCDLDEKMNAPARTLSGGQKRKCQLAMMLTGNSSMCLLDEVSSGLDPLSRRKIWDILLAERGKRSILLTTHFLDEADLLSDDITILSKGNLVANGSAVALKHERGGGYRVRVYHEDHKPLPADLEATTKQVFHDQTVYQLSSSGDAARFISELEKAEVRDYQVNGPTIEDVFLNLAEEVKEELEKDRAPSPVSGEGLAEDKGLQLTTGKHLSFFGQTWVLFRKRATILQRNTWPYAAALLIPIIAAGLVTLFLTGFTALSCAPTAQVDTSQREALDFFLAVNANIPTGPPRDVSTQLLNSLYPILEQPFHSVSTFNAFNDYISANYSKVTPGGFFLGSVPTLAWKGNYDMAYAIATMNLMDVSLLDIPIVTAYQPFNYPFIPTAGKSLQFILYFGLAMSAYPGFFALYTNAERLRNVRALHYSNGVRAGPLWIAYTLFDFIIVLLVSAIAVIIFVSLPEYDPYLRQHDVIWSQPLKLMACMLTYGQTSVTDIWYGPGYLFVVFVFYGLSATVTAYVVSLFTTSQLATFAFAAGGQCSMFLLYFISYMCIITYAPTAKIDRDVNIAHFTIGLFFPSGNLLRALLLSFNQFSLLCRGDQLASYPGAIDVYGGPILYLILQSMVMLNVLIWYDSGWKPGFLARTRHRVPDAEETEEIDGEVYAEAKRVDDSKDELRVLHATKAFGSNVAVQDVTFGVPKGEIFSLLGPNGAGKVNHISFHR